MSSFVKLYIDYDRNGHGSNEGNLADVLITAASDAGKLYVDFYATPDAVDAFPPNWYFDPKLPSKKRRKWNKWFNLSTVSVYVCAQVNSANHLRALWRNFSYSSPKMYRISEVARTAEEAALRGEIVEKFQWIPLDGLTGLLNTSACIFRDFHDEVGLEVLCRTDYETRIKHLVNIYLSNEVTILPEVGTSN